MSVDDLGININVLDDIDLDDLGDIPNAQQSALSRGLSEDQQAQADIHALFSSDLGQRVLRWLIEKTLLQPVISRHMLFDVPRENLEALALLREGENYVVRRFIEAYRDFESLTKNGENHE